MKKRMLCFGIAGALLLSGCSQEDAHMETQAAHQATKEESANLHLLDQELEDISAEEWESMHLSETDFDQFLSSLPEKDEKGFQEISEVSMKGTDIRIVLNNTNGDTLDNLLSAPFLDAKVRQAYLQSAYFDGRQPAIQIMDSAGTVLSDTDEPLDLAKP